VPELQLDLRRPHSQRLQATLKVTPRSHTIQVALPRWTPGSYLLRDYVGHLECLEAWQGTTRLPLRRISPSAWQLHVLELMPLQLRYGIQATELTVRTCHLSAEHGFLALAAVALEVEGERWSPHNLRLQLPDGWQPFVPLPRQGDGSWLAADFDQLVDSPVEVGPHPSHGFTVAGVPHRWVSWGGDVPQQDPSWLADVERVCQACCRVMGVGRPAADSYLFVLHLTEQGYGGLEHDASTVLQYSRRQLNRPEGRRRLLQLVAHEYLHQWNVRRLRPAELTPIDYGDAVVVPTLWFAEGVTSYLDQLLPHAAGCCSAEAVLEDLGSDLSRYLLSPGRLLQSLVSSSEEAWVKLYRPHPHAANQQVSYYLKGAVLALVLDLHLRRQGSWLGQVLQDLWASHGRQRRGYRQQDLLSAFARHAPELASLLPQWLSSTEDPPLDAYLADVGLQLEPELAATPWVGWQLEQRPGAGVVVARMARDSPGQRAGLQVGDELIAINGERMRTLDDWAQLAPRRGSSFSLMLCRDGLVDSAVIEADPPAVERWCLRPLDGASAAVLARRRAWLALEP
jgi:predicted metalloprotease with PDZ domain